MKIVRALSLAFGAALALPALADDAVIAVVAPVDAATVVTAAQLDPVLDVAVVEQSAASGTDVLGLTPSVTTGLIFFVVAVTLFKIGTDGNSGE